MVKQEELDNQGGDSKETPEQAEFSRQLKEVAENPNIEGEEHEHSHGEETQEKKDKLADGIMARADNCSELVKKRARKLAEDVREKGLSAINDLQNDYANLVDNFHKNDETIEGLKKHYPDWTRQDFDDLYISLYGENSRGQTYEEIQENQKEVEKNRKEYNEWLANKKVEDAKRKEEEKKRDEEYEKQRIKDALAEEDAERIIKQNAAEQERNSRWFGLGRFFGGKK